jgi:hypothetical protein
MEMDKEGKSIECIGFATSIRGRLILDQALSIGIKELNKVEGAMKQLSNIRDMEYMRDNLCGNMKGVSDLIVSEEVKASYLS